MKFAALVAILATIATSASAGCNTFGTTTTCDDGTTYHQFGNITQGSNNQTGANWSQTQLGNTTFGNDSDGNSWSQTQVGNSVFGTDSDGNSYSCFRGYDGKMICN